MKLKTIFGLLLCYNLTIGYAANNGNGTIDRKALLARNSPVVSKIDSLSSLSVGNGAFAFTVDATGLQTFPQLYRNGVPLGTQSQWGWHSFPNPNHYTTKDVLKSFDFGHGHKEVYACQFNEPGRQREAANWLRSNPHRLHLGYVGLMLDGEAAPSAISQIHQKLNLAEGKIQSCFTYKKQRYKVETICHPEQDLIAARITGSRNVGIRLDFPYPTGGHCDDASNWHADEKHSTLVLWEKSHSVLLKRIIDDTTYYILLSWDERSDFTELSKNHFALTSKSNKLTFSCLFSQGMPPFEENIPFEDIDRANRAKWKAFWFDGAAVDFSSCTDARARELERRVVLSQYLLAIQCAGNTPPQETGLTYNSWYGKFHLEMIWWHQAWQALWGHENLLQNTLRWYATVEPIAREIAQRQGFKGVRWMKMTDPSGKEAPSNVGSFLIWQQPHLIYLAELAYRANPSQETIRRYYTLVQATAEFMASFVSFDEKSNRYVLKGAIPAQETLAAATTLNSPFELSYWHFALSVAQKWRERACEKRVPLWDDIIKNIAPLAYNEELLYLASEDAVNTYKDIRLFSYHMAVLGAVGILPMNRLVNRQIMRNTLDWVWRNWNWNKTWGWDYPMTAMNATRLGEPEMAINALLMDKRTNTYLINGHNYQDTRLRCYLPGNGGLLTAIALMCAGWEGCEVTNPGFPKDGRWNVKWEGLSPLP